MRKIATSLQIIITGGIAIIIMLSGITLARLEASDSVGLAIVIFCVVGTLKYALIRAERIEICERADRLHQTLQDIRGQQNIIHARLEQIIKAMGHKLPAVHLRGKITIDPLDAAYGIRHSYESHRRRRWLYLLGLKRSLALCKSRDQLTEDDKEQLLTWLKEFVDQG